MKNVLLSLFLFAATAANASFQGSVVFTAEEQARHKDGLNTILDSAAGCLQKTLDRHTSFYRQHGISPYFGDQSAFAKMSTEAKRAHIRRLGKNPSLLAEMEPTSCVGLAIKCLGGGFRAAGQGDLWDRIMGFTRANGVDGTAMQSALRELGWKIYYWNPDTRQSAAWDAADKRRNPGNPKNIWGYHAYRLSTVRNSSMYYNSIVDDDRLLVNFGENPPEQFKRAPFFIGTAHAGYHVFPGFYGKVVEGHSTRAITDRQTVESSPFNPLADGGGPRGQYFTGIIALPPGY